MIVYEVGDYVVVVKPEDADSFPFGWNDEMDAFVGHVYKVVEKGTMFGSTYYNLDAEEGDVPDLDWLWCDGFLRLADYGENYEWEVPEPREWEVPEPREYEVGDHVIVVKPEDADNYAVGWNEKMDEFIGRECEIESKFNSGSFGCTIYCLRLSETDTSLQWHWVSEFLTPAYQEPDFDFDPEVFNELLVRF